MIRVHNNLTLTNLRKLVNESRAVYTAAMRREIGEQWEEEDNTATEQMDPIPGLEIPHESNPRSVSV